MNIPWLGFILRTQGFFREAQGLLGRAERREANVALFDRNSESAVQRVRTTAASTVLAIAPSCAALKYMRPELSPVAHQWQPISQILTSPRSKVPNFQPPDDRGRCFCQEQSPRDNFGLILDYTKNMARQVQTRNLDTNPTGEKRPV